MIGSISAQVALFAFSVAIFAGIYAGNAPATILTRAMTVMAAALMLGQIVGGVGKAVVRDYLMRRKHEIDHGHSQAMERINKAASEKAAGA